MKAEVDCATISEQGQRTADSLVQSVPIVSLAPSSLFQLSSYGQMGELDADIDDVGRYQDGDNDDDEDAGQWRVRQMVMAQTVIYVEPGGTLHIVF